MSQERNPFKEAVFDVIGLKFKLQSEENKRTWDLGIMGVGVLESYLLAGNINTEPGTLVRAVILLVPPVVAGLGLLMSAIRSERIANVKGQMEGIERQVLRTTSLQNPTNP